MHISMSNRSVLKQSPNQPLLQRKTCTVRKVKLHRLSRERTNITRRSLHHHPHHLPSQSTPRSLVLLTIPSILRPLQALLPGRNGSSRPVHQPLLCMLPHHRHQHNPSSPCSSKAKCQQKRKAFQIPKPVTPRNLSSKVNPVLLQTQVWRSHMLDFMYDVPFVNLPIKHSFCFNIMLYFRIRSKAKETSHPMCTTNQA